MRERASTDLPAAKRFRVRIDRTAAPLIERLIAANYKRPLAAQAQPLRAQWGR